MSPRHALLGAFVAGLLACAHPLAVVGCAAVAAAALRPRAAVVAALLAGAVLGQARLAQLDHTALGPLLGHAVDERATLLDLPRATPFGGWSATARVRGERVALTAGRWISRPEAGIGARLDVAGTLKPLSPGQRWMRLRNVHAALAARTVQATGVARGGFAGFVDRVRVRAEHALRAGAPPRVSGLLRGMVLGEGEALDPAMQDDFRAASLTHLVAASGQNVALLAALAVALATALGLGLRARLVLALALVVVYVPLAGAGPSIQRAGIMGGAALVAGLAGRPASRWYALLLAAAVTLVANPRAAADPGWQLSFAAVVGIAVGAEPIARRLRRRRVPPAAAEAVALTVAATLATAPLIALHFGRTSPVGLPANVLAAPAVAPAMWLGAVAASIGQLSAPAAAPFSALAAVPAAYLAWLGHAAAHVRVALSLGALLGCAPPAPPAARVSFLDVGQGDATLIQAAGHAVLVDAGPVGDNIAKLVRHEGARRLDLLVVTHAQADHEGGAAEVLSELPVGAVLDGRDGIASPDGTRMAAGAAAHRVRILRPDAGEILRAGPIRLDVLSPPASGRIAGEDPNTRAIVLEATLAGTRLLLTADAESDVLGGLSLGPVDLLKVSHHGSADPGLPALLAVLRPRAAVIEVGRHNPYGHPAPATVAALATGAGRVLRTDRDGTVRFDLTPGGLALTTHA